MGPTPTPTPTLGHATTQAMAQVSFQHVVVIDMTVALLLYLFQYGMSCFTVTERVQETSNGANKTISSRDHSSETPSKEDGWVVRRQMSLEEYEAEDTAHIAQSLSLSKYLNQKYKRVLKKKVAARREHILGINILLFIIFCGFGSAGFSDTAIRWTTTTMFDPVTITSADELRRVDAQGSPIYLQLAIPGGTVVTPKSITGKALERGLPSDNRFKVKYFYYQWPVTEQNADSHASAIIVAAALDQNYASFKPYNFDALHTETLDCIFEQLVVDKNKVCVGNLKPAARAECVYKNNTTKFAKKIPKHCGLLIGHLQPVLEVANHDTFLKLDRAAQKQYWKGAQRGRKRREDTPLMVHALVVNMPFYSVIAVIVVGSVPVWLCFMLIYNMYLYAYYKWFASQTKLFFGKIERRSIRRLRSYFTNDADDTSNGMSNATLPQLVAWLDNAAAAATAAGVATAIPRRHSTETKAAYATLTDSAFVAQAGSELILVLYYASGDQLFRMIPVSTIEFVDRSTQSLVIKHLEEQFLIQLPSSLSMKSVDDVLLFTQPHPIRGSYAARRAANIETEAQVQRFTNDERLERERVASNHTNEQSQLSAPERLRDQFQLRPASDSVRAWMHAAAVSWPVTGCDPNTNCAVCLCELEDSDEVTKWWTCEHYFHLDCVLQHARRNHVCPLCRSEVEKAPVQARVHSSEDIAFLRRIYGGW